MPVAAASAWKVAVADALVDHPPAVSGLYGLAVAAGLDQVNESAQFGGLRTGPGWSTMKVPLAVAALNEPGNGTAQSVRSALTRSDNAAAGSLWDALGSGRTAAGKVDTVLAHRGSTARTQPQVTRPGFSAFGQTEWALVDQASFTAALRCGTSDADRQVMALLGNVTPSQRWGAGRWPGAQFKGGWGPAPNGTYTVRQLAVLPHDGGWTAVSLAVTARSGTFEQGVGDLDVLERWLHSRAHLLPLTHCQPGLTHSKR